MTSSNVKEILDDLFQRKGLYCPVESSFGIYANMLSGLFLVVEDQRRITDWDKKIKKDLFRFPFTNDILV